MQTNLNKKKIFIIAGSALLLAGSALAGYFAYAQFSKNNNNNAVIDPLANKELTESTEEESALYPLIKACGMLYDMKNPEAAEETKEEEEEATEKGLHPIIKAYANFYDEQESAKTVA